LFAEEDIGEDEKIIELIGRRVAAEEADALEKQYHAIGIKDCFLFMVDEHELIDCTHKSNAARFANHSCKPNMEAKIIKSGGKNRVIYVSLRAVKNGVFSSVVIEICD
jgi:SET domain-containing protein